MMFAVLSAINTTNYSRAQLQRRNSPTSLPGGSPACDVTLSRLQEAVHRRGEAHGLDGVGHGCRDGQLQEGHVLVQVGAVELWVDDDALDGDDQSPTARAQHRSQAHRPVVGAGIPGSRKDRYSLPVVV